MQTRITHKGIEYLVEGHAVPMGPSELGPHGLSEVTIEHVWAYDPELEDYVPASLPAAVMDSVFDRIQDA